MDTAASRAAQMQALLDGSGVGVVTGEGNLVLEANEEFLRLVGRDADALRSGLDWAAITPSEHLERDAGALGDVWRQGNATVLKDFLRPDGSRVPVLAAVSVVSREPYRWAAVVVDLSRDERLRALAQSEAAIVNALLAEAPVGFAFLDTELRFVRVNEAIAAMNGFSVQEHEGVGVFELLPGLRESAEPVLRRVLETGEPLRDVPIVGTTRADPGREHTWLESFFPVRMPDGPVVGVATLANDVTELHRLQAELHETVGRQQQALLELQRGLLPDLPQVAGAALQAHYLAASSDVHLGGDWFDGFLAPDGRLLLSVGDVVGHGLSAVGLMARAAGAVRAYVQEGHAPGEVLHLLNQLLVGPATSGLATAAVLAVDLGTGQVEYALAGHPPPVLQDGGSAVLLDDAVGTLLGADPAATYTSATATLPPGAALLLYTDGLVERRDESIEQGLARLLAVTRRTAPDALLTEVLEACLPGSGREDDVCVLTLARHGEGG